MIREFKHISSKLSSIYSEQEAISITYILFEDLLGIKKTEIFTSAKERLTPTEKQILKNALNDLLNHVPVQHITGFSDFMGLKIKVNKNVLIPRQETEELVLLCQQHIGFKKLNILDIGTGSGCIPVVLKLYNPLLLVVSVDKSEAALSVARENAKANNADVDFIQMDILDEALWSSFQIKFDVIISNPPYVTKQDKYKMQKNVLDHEPEIALFVPDDDPFIFYRAIAQFSQNALADQGEIFLEINEYLGPEAKRLFENEGFREARILKDVHEKDRMLMVRK
ncbi:MAG: peptide chain release factor N(5)-glutamine methyltransferase [Bacteroidetes bacterium]|nr:peptide chain release factor N(5)-glutamine methyltransferase [Bacteroidota bacterium]MBL6963796.1 peptide chain release factor N(5)-glutamine methyltransferase [Bacteroidota bacterium]